MTDWTSLRYAVADVEGNGQQPPDLVELAVLPITDGTIGEPVSWLVRPPRPITRFATSIHGISGQDVASAPAFADIEHEVRRALADRVLVAHNAHVDVGVLRRELGGWESARGIRHAQARQAAAARASPVTSSARWSRRCPWTTGMPPGLAPHRAAYDVLVTARLFVRLATRHDGSPVSLDELRGQAGDQNPGEHR